LPDEFVRAGKCISLSRVGREQCAGGCESQASNILTLANMVYQLGNSTCQCCSPKETYTETISMECNEIGIAGYITSATYTHIESCECQVCNGSFDQVL
jgi:Cystine-knot domain